MKRMQNNFNEDVRLRLLKRVVLMLGLLTIIGCVDIPSMREELSHATGNTGVTITGSNLSGGAITFTDFPSVTLNGSSQTTSTNWGIAPIIDARGNGSGWNLSLTLTPLREYDSATTSYVPSGYTLPTGSITVQTSPILSLIDNSSSPLTGMSTVATGTALDTGTSVKLAIAPAVKGMGSYSFSNLGVTLTVPANSYAKLYRTDATVALSSGP